MNILSINIGSNSCKFKIFNMESKSEIIKGNIIGTDYGPSKLLINDETINIDKKKNYEDYMKLIVSYLTKNEPQKLVDKYDLSAIGFRIIFGGEKFTEPTIINEDIIFELNKFDKVDLLHNQKVCSSLKYFINSKYDIPVIGVFDSAFHNTIPKENYLYAIPYEWYKLLGIRKYGYHGISYQNALKNYCNITNVEQKKVNSIMCHLGGGSSMCAIKNGESYDTTMGYSPLSGLIMASRSGDIDPTIIKIVCEHYNLTLDELFDYLNKNSGYVPFINDNNAVTLVEKVKNGDAQAKLFIKMLQNDFNKNLFKMMSNLEIIDSIILTGTISVKNREMRWMLLNNLKYWGVKLDEIKNKNLIDANGLISEDDSKLKIYVINSDEELEIAEECQKKVLTRGKKI